MADYEVPLKYIQGDNTYTFIDPRYDPDAPPPETGDPAAFQLWDVRNWVNSGETWDPTGVTFVNAILQRAINALSDLYVVDGIVRQVYVPNGTYRIGWNITNKSGVGIRGESEKGCVFMLELDKKFVAAGATSNIHWESFTIDGANQTGTEYDVFTKGFYLQNLTNCSFRNVTVRNTIATGFGVDHLDGVTFDHCTAINCGRGVFLYGSETLPGASGFGLGCGDVVRNREPVSLIGCVARGNGKFGIFIEEQGVGGSQKAPGYKVIGCHMEGNLHGFGDVGAKGVMFIGNTVMDQRTNGSGIFLNTTSIGDPGVNGRIAHNLIAYNPVGIRIGATEGPYTIESNEIISNTGDGIQSIIGVLSAGMTIRGNSIRDNGGWGFRTDKGHTELMLDQNTIRDNTLGGISMTGAGSVSGLTVRLNDLRGSTVTISQTITTGLTTHDNLGWTYP